MKVQINYNKKYRGEDYSTNNILLEYFDLKSTCTCEKEVFQKLYKKFEKTLKMKYSIDIDNFDRNTFERLYIRNITITKILKLISQNPNISDNNALQKYTKNVSDQYKNSKIVYNIV